VETVTVEGSHIKLDLAKLQASYDGEIDATGNDKPVEIRRPQNPVPPYPYRTEEVTVRNEKAAVSLAGTFAVPPGKGPFPAVLLITGSGPQDRDESLMGHRPFLVLADHLARKGVAVLRLDDRNAGKSTGSFGEAATLDFAADAESAVTWLRARAEVRPKQIGLAGHSEGGLIASIIGSRNQDVAFLVLLAGTGVTGEQILYQQAGDIIKAAGGHEDAVTRNRDTQKAIFRIVRENPDHEAAATKLKELQASSPPAQIRNVNTPWFRQFLDLDPAAYLSKVKVPVLALNGELDLQVSAAGKKDHEEQSLPGLNHLFQHASTGLPNEYGKIEETLAPEVLERVSAWILRRCPPPVK
jgi:hypothetical protein